ncbi:MAG: exonuclease subunit SbcD, partial [Candidatus Margulisbacteria bacterium]|nr:exonuclease subunit SbcD [Candidatus Margulisiibacteriota bacterium]
MRILHTSDWHIGKRLESYSRLNEQKEVLNEICEVADNEKVDAVIVAGDLYDTYNPPAEAVDFFYKTLKRLTNHGTRPVICIAGNHDSPDRIEAPDPLARECGIIFAGYPNSKIPPFELDTGLSVTQSDEGFIELRLSKHKELLRVLLFPYGNESRLRTCLNAEDTVLEMREIIKAKWQAIADKYCDEQGINVLVH